MNYQNVSRLTNRIENIINDMLYCWIDNKGLICQQKIMFRVNCIDCLDRTNVIQSVISKNVLVNQVLQFLHLIFIFLKILFLNSSYVELDYLDLKLN